MLATIEVTWRPVDNRAYEGLLGRHRVAFVLRHEGEYEWRWLLSACNGHDVTAFRSASSLDEAKMAVQDGLEVWFRKAGLLADRP